MRVRFLLRAGLAFALGLASIGQPARGETLVFAGVGAAVTALEALGRAWTAQDPGFETKAIAGLGTTGAVRALIDGRIDLAAAGRALDADMKRNHRLRTVAFASTPFGVVTSNPAVTGLSRAELGSLLAGATPRWSDGMPVRFILRPVSDSDTVQFGKYFPDQRANLDRLRARRELPIATTDGENFDLAEATPGAFAFGTLTQIVAERRKLRLLAIDGVAPSVENLAAGRYPYEKPFFFVLNEAPPEKVGRFLAFLATPAAAKLMVELGLIPATADGVALPRKNNSAAAP